MEPLENILRRFRLPTSSGGSPLPPEEEKPSCPLCKGTRWVKVPVPPGDPRFGEIEPCICWEREEQEARRARLLRIGGLTGALSRLTFDSLDPEGRSPDPEDRRLFREAVEAARSYAEGPRGWLVLTGPPGSGKTHLACALAHQAIERGTPALYLSTPDLLDHLRSAFAPSSDVPYDTLFEQVRGVPLLVLDDLGSHASTPWAQEKLFQVLNYRFLQELPTVLVLSIPPFALEERLRSRLMDRQRSRVLTLARAQPPGPALLTPPQTLLGEMTFEAFDVRGAVETTASQRATLEAALQASRHFAQRPRGWLVLTGPPGSGKTHLAVAIIAERMRAGESAAFAFVPDLLDHLRSAFAPSSEVPYDTLFEQVKKAPLLVLDDLGSHSSTPWAEEKLYQLLASRYDHRLPTVITMDIRVQVRPAIASRLRDQRLVTLIEMDAPDYRASPRPRRPRPSG